jgi:hypothetical protein
MPSYYWKTLSIIENNFLNFLIKSRIKICTEENLKNIRPKTQYIRYRRKYKSRNNELSDVDESRLMKVV